jgi:hypothetical protein
MVPQLYRHFIRYEMLENETPKQNRITTDETNFMGFDYWEIYWAGS